MRATSVTNWRSPEGPPKIITPPNLFATYDVPVLAKAHLESPRQTRLGIHGASQDLWRRPPYYKVVRFLLERDYPRHQRLGVLGSEVDITMQGERAYPEGLRKGISPHGCVGTQAGKFCR